MRYAFFVCLAWSTTWLACTPSRTRDVGEELHVAPRVASRAQPERTMPSAPGAEPQPGVLELLGFGVAVLGAIADGEPCHSDDCLALRIADRSVALEPRGSIQAGERTARARLSGR